MDFQLSDEQRHLRDEVRRFADEEIRPVATEHDVDESYPHEVMETAADMGLLAPHVPVEYGGVGYSALENAILTEELFAADPGIGLCVSSAGFGAEAIMGFGSEEQKERILPEVTAGDAIMGSAISEPQAGSDVTSVATRARKDGDEWVINGSKMWITNGTVADYFVVVCETDPEIEDRYTGFSQILVEADRDGLTAEKITGKLGIRASDTAELVFDDVRVPEENLIGQRGMGFLQLDGLLRRNPDCRRGSGRRDRPRRGRASAGVRRGARAVRPPHLGLPGDQTQTRGDAHRHRGGPLAHLPVGVGRR